ncbi:TIGR01777 family oxidoreductase [Luteimicrobium sp. DT211]|uniref:TIGR01777 family oxidoreductase n=1 Tax=Luteimicrobium sp. DT211 TaxID=3393412 RepID=UPI003CEB4732
MTPARGTVVVAGAGGLIGTRLVASLVADGVPVRRLVRPGSDALARHADGVTPVAWDPDRGVLPEDALDGAAAVVNLGGVGIGDRRWTQRSRAVLRSSRLAGTGLLARELARRGPDAPALVQASAMGFYGDRGDEPLPETARRGDGFLADLVADWEAATDPARDAGVRVVLLRTSLVLAPEGGALGRLLPLLRAGLGGPLGDGREFWSWITLPDHVRAIRHLASSGVHGPVNLASPDPVRNAELTRAVARALHRPAVLRVPAPALHLALGGFAGDILASARLVPRVLEADDFRWEHPRLADAVAWLVADGRGRVLATPPAG